MRIRALLVALLLIAGAWPASAENVLRFATSNEALSCDPHVGPHLFTANRALLVYEGLTHVSRDLRLMPSLATSWQVSGLTSWEFDIRDGVRFHDGTALTPEDVVFSLERARGATAGVRSFLPEIVAIERVGSRRIRITTADTAPDLPAVLTRVAILSRAWAERNAAVAVDDPDSAQGTFARDHANGTGPFSLEEFRRNARTAVVRNGGWWGRDIWPHNVDRVEYVYMTDYAELAQALIDGRIDFLPDVPPNQLERLRHAPGVKVLSAPTVRFSSLSLNWRPDQLETSSAPRPNPFRDRRVREAIYRSLDMEAFCKGFMRIEKVPVTCARDALIEDLWRRHIEEVVYVPLYTQVAVWAMRDYLDFPVDPRRYYDFRYARLTGAPEP